MYGSTNHSTYGGRRPLMLKDVQAVQLRNVYYTGFTKGEWLPNLYFEIVVEGSTVLYRSELAVETLNPVWNPIDTIRFSDAAISEFEFRVFSSVSVHVPWWCMQQRSSAIPGSAGVQQDSLSLRSSVENIKEDSSILLTLQVDLGCFEPLGMALSSAQPLPNNAIVLEVDGDIYVHTRALAHLRGLGFSSSGSVRSHLGPTPHMVVRKEVDLEVAAHALKKMVDLYTRIGELRKKTEEKRDSIVRRVEKETENLQLERKCREYRERNETLRETLKMRKLILERETGKRLEEENWAHDTEQLLYGCQQLERLENDIATSSDRMYLERSGLLRILKKIRTRQATLVIQLRNIYPIEYIGNGEYAIRGIKLHNTELASRDEEQVSTALGYICHLVFMLSKYFQVPLRYSLVHFSSRSYVRDCVQGTVAEFPLYRRGQDRDRFDTAVTLLHKDVEQLVQARSLDIQGAAPMLACLKAIFDVEAKRRSSGVASN